MNLLCKSALVSTVPVGMMPPFNLITVKLCTATKNYKELFAESFALHLSGKKIPEGLVRLLEKSISYAKANRGE